MTPKPKRLRPRQAKRAHKSKQEQRRTSGARVYGGRVQYVDRLKVNGQKKQSAILRVDAAFAEWVRREARRDGVTVTAYTRDMVGKFLAWTPLPGSATVGNKLP